MPESTRSSLPPDAHLWVTVLAGGVGSRFWPVSTPSRPKQLLRLSGERPLIVETVQRARLLAPDERIRILTGAHLVGPFREAMPELTADTFLVEPRARGTGPALAWAAWLLHRQDPDAVIVSMHADHVIRRSEAFRDLLQDAVRVARERDLLVTVGVKPIRPDPGFGYIAPGDRIELEDVADAFEVGSFIEKPDAVTAGNYIENGYLWNSGIFVWRAERFLEEVRRHAPEIAEHLGRLEDGGLDDFFAAVQPITVDVAVMERSERVAVIAATFDWDDVGSWEALSRTLDLDADGNVAVGTLHAVESGENIVYGGQEPVVLYGVDGLVVVRTTHATLVTTRARAADLKAVLDRLPDELLKGGAE